MAGRHTTVVSKMMTTRNMFGSLLEGMTRARAQLEGPHSKHLPPSGQHCSSVRRKGTGSHWPSQVLSSLAACME